MAIRTDSRVELTLQSFEHFTNRTDIRTHILDQWKIEIPNNRYRYFVEILQNGTKIYLERPGNLNKGCDFVIHIENHRLHKNNNDKAPNFDLFIQDLELKKKDLSHEEWNNLLYAIREIYNCNPYPKAFAYISKNRIIGEDYELILKVLKWFFIEQDITYWAGQGREMLYNRILKV